MRHKGFSLMELLVIVAVIAIIAAIVLPSLKRAHEKATIDKGQVNQNRANELINDMTYIKDPRTQECFAYVWDYDVHGGSKFTAVPCESVPDGLLITAVIEDK